MIDERAVPLEANGEGRCLGDEQDERSDDRGYNKLLSEYLYRLADKSYETEEGRGRTLADLSVQLLTCITILSVAFLTPASFLFECYGDGESDITPAQMRLAWMYAVVLIPLVIGLLLVLYARVLKTMNVLSSPGAQMEYVQKLYDDRNSLRDDGSGKTEQLSELEIAESYCAGIEEKYQGMVNKHNKMWMLLRRSMYLIAGSCIAALVFGLVLLFELRQ